MSLARPVQAAVFRVFRVFRGHLLFCLAAALLLSSFHSRAAPQSEYKLKAQLLVLFAHHTSWGTNDFTSKEAPFVFGIVGEDPFGKEGDYLLKIRPVQNHKVEIKVFKSIEEISACQVVFIPSFEIRHVKALRLLSEHHILTVSDAKEIEGTEFAQMGGVVRIGLRQKGVTEYKPFAEISDTAMPPLGPWTFDQTLLKAEGIQITQSKYMSQK
ncbi:MAG: hypothetical protein C5B50_06095 [Verrucomicrobia bacterium]|nr:MAG: hypothetical protein C5B50_06095 [Verrucomicrobiota bacterium]